MQERNISSTKTPKDKTPLEEKGHLNRIQLYILLAILSIAVLGLCGYIMWDYSLTDTPSRHETDVSSSDTTQGQYETEAGNEVNPQPPQHSVSEDNGIQDPNDPYYGWQEYTYSSNDYSYSFYFPPNKILDDTYADISVDIRDNELSDASSYIIIDTEPVQSSYLSFEGLSRSEIVIEKAKLFYASDVAGEGGGSSIYSKEIADHTTIENDFGVDIEKISLIVTVEDWFGTTYSNRTTTEHELLPIYGFVLPHQSDDTLTILYFRVRGDQFEDTFLESSGTEVLEDQGFLDLIVSSVKVDE